MKLAAVKAIAELAKEPVPEMVKLAYNVKNIGFGREYFIPKPFDNRVLLKVAPAVAKAAMASGVAQIPIEDLSAYAHSLEMLQSRTRGFIRTIINRVRTYSTQKSQPKPTIYFPEGRSTKILKAVNSIMGENIYTPVLIGFVDQIRAKIKELELDHLEGVRIIQPSIDEKTKEYIQDLYENRKRKGVMNAEAERLMHDPNYFAAMAVHRGDADGMITGATMNYSECVRPILEIIGAGRSKVASGMNFVLHKDRLMFFADTTMNINPTAEQLASIAVLPRKPCRSPPSPAAVG
jgi:malate dehydrogenase (oxaloacetate-decarboxylating)(NADP+)